jgi:toxin ParE1/3/4
VSNPPSAVHLSNAAERDLAKIIRDTLADFGAKQAESYRDVLPDAMGDLANGPNVLGSKSRDEVVALGTFYSAEHGAT